MSTLILDNDWLFYVILIVAVVVFSFIFIKFSYLRIYILYFICFVIIGFGVYSCIGLNSMLNVSSSDIGSAIHLEEKHEFDLISKFDFGVIPLESEDNINYSCVKNFSFEEFDGNNKNYVILFNDKPCDDIYLTSGSISGVLKLNFYDTNGDVVVTARMNILIEYFSKETRVSVSISNVDDAVSYLNSEMNIHGAVINVVEVL